MTTTDPPTQPLTDREAWQRERLLESLDAYERGLAAPPIVQRAATTQTLLKNDNRPLTFVASDESVDRYGDVVRADGWDLRAYRRNPVFLWAHDYTRTPIGRSDRVELDDTRLLTTVSFAPTPFAQEVATLYRQRYLRAVSVGFRARAFAFRKNAQGQIEGVEYTTQELVEISAVPVPANPQALAKALDGRIEAPRMRSWFACGGLKAAPATNIDEQEVTAILDSLRTLRRAVA